MADPFRFVILGSGNIAGTYVDALGKVPGARLAGIVSRSGRRPPAPAAADVEVRASLGEIRAGFDAVIVATPNGLHRQGIEAAAAMGKHALCEKPLEITVRAADRAIAACRLAGVTLGVCYQRRTRPDNIAVKAFLDAGRLGRLYAADLSVKFWREQSYYDSAPYRGGWDIDGGGPFMQQASHQLDTWLWFFGRPRAVKSFTATLAHRMEAEDHGAALLRCDSGMIGTIVASTAAKPGFPVRLEIHGEKGSIVMENDVITRWAVDGADNPSAAPDGPQHSGAGAAGALVADTSGHEAIIADFIRAAREHRAPAVPGEEARMTTELAQRIYRAARR